jgi:hypothetical protein
MLLSMSKLRIRTFSITRLILTTFSITRLKIMTLSIAPISIVTLYDVDAECVMLSAILLSVTHTGCKN